MRDCSDPNAGRRRNSKAMSIEEQFVSMMDARFRLWSGSVDLLQMSQQCPDEFRRYVAYSRFLRAMKPLNQGAK